MPTAEEFEQDISSLEYEITQLERKKVDLLKELEKVRINDPLETSLDQLKTLLKTKVQNKKKDHALSPLEDRPSPKKRKTDQSYASTIPNPVTHEYFDRSIAKYFLKDSNVENTDSEHKYECRQQLLSIKKSECVLLENIYRMFGITAFPVRKPNSIFQVSGLLGIRIEIFNGSNLTFETPHYIILRENTKNGKWDIYRHTVPNFVQIRTLASTKFDNLSDFYLFDFLKEVRDILNKVALKHQIIDAMKEAMSKNILNLEKDIPLEVLTFDLKIPDQVWTPVVFNLSLEAVESSHIERGFTDTEKARINNVLKGPIRTFPKRLQDVIYSISF